MELKTFYDNFELMAEAPNGIQKLREMILQLAVQGKLVTQDPKDKSAAALCEIISAERERFLNDKRARKMVPLQSFEDQEIPFKLPSGWEWVRIGGVMNLINGKAFKPSDWSNEGLPIIRIQNLNNPDAPFNFCAHTIDQKFHVEDMDFLISWSGTPGTSFGAHIWQRGKALLNQHIFKAELFGSAFDKFFLKISINTRLNEMISQAHGGVGLQHITKGKLEMLPIALPPTKEQKRIVAKVDELMALCDDLDARKQKTHQACIQLNDASIDKLLTAPSPAKFNRHWRRIADNFDLLYGKPENVIKLRQAILQLAVQGKLVKQDPKDEPASVLLKKVRVEKERMLKDGEIRKTKPLPGIQPGELPFNAPSGWEWEKIDRLCFVTKLAGFEYTKYIVLKDVGEVPVIRAQNVKMDWINESNLKYIDSKTSNSLERSALNKPSILMTFIGAGIGDVAIFDKLERWHLAPDVAKIEPYNGKTEVIDLRYLLIFLMSNIGRAEIFKHKKATAQPSLSMGTIRDAIVAIPPLNEQKSIVAKVDQLVTLCDDLEAQLIKGQARSGRLLEAAVADLLAA